MTAVGPASTCAEKASEDRPQPDETDNCIEDFQAEAPSRARLSPGPTISSSDGVVNSSTNASQNSLYRFTSISDDQHAVGTLDDEHGDIVTWSLAASPEGLHTSLHTTDIRNVIGLGEFPWPLSATDTDCQIDFGMPFTVRHADVSTVGSSTALGEGDTALLFNRSAAAYESSKPSEEMIRPLNLNNKVRMIHRVSSMY
jgi:hypothetical protein